MVQVRINGESSSLRADGLPKMTDLIELIKASIDPDHMITRLLMNGQELSEAEWNAPTSKLGTAVIEVETGSPKDFVADRLKESPSIVRMCYMQFRDSRKAFQDGNMQEGNRELLEAVNTLKAFFEWFLTILELIPLEARKPFDVNEQVLDISDVCKRICQQQLYHSWWALGESLEKELEPRLDKFEDLCRRMGRAF